jgi:hypothetical protein
MRNDIRHAMQYYSAAELAPFAEPPLIFGLRDPYALSFLPGKDRVESSFKRGHHVHAPYVIKELLEGRIAYGVEFRRGLYSLGQYDHNPHLCGTSWLLRKIINPEIVDTSAHRARANLNHLSV